MSEPEAKLPSEMSGEEELQMRVSGREPSIHTIAPNEIREIGHYPEEDRERDVMGAHAPNPITGSHIFISSDTGEVTVGMVASLLSHEVMHHILLAEIGIEASRMYDAVAEDYHEGFKEKEQRLREGT
jgi:hypothetical protein